MVKVKVTAIGNSIGIVLPKEVSARLKVGKGDTLFLTETPDGYALGAGDPSFEQFMELAEEGMRAYPNALRELAK